MAQAVAEYMPAIHARNRLSLLLNDNIDPANVFLVTACDLVQVLLRQLGRLIILLDLFDFPYFFAYCVSPFRGASLM